MKTLIRKSLVLVALFLGTMAMAQENGTQNINAVVGTYTSADVDAPYIVANHGGTLVCTYSGLVMKLRANENGGFTSDTGKRFVFNSRNNTLEIKGTTNIIVLKKINEQEY